MRIAPIYFSKMSREGYQLKGQPNKVPFSKGWKLSKGEIATQQFQGSGIPNLRKASNFAIIFFPGKLPFQSSDELMTGIYCYSKGIFTFEPFHRKLIFHFFWMFDIFLKILLSDFTSLDGTGKMICMKHLNIRKKLKISWVMEITKNVSAHYNGIIHSLIFKVLIRENVQLLPV